MKEKHNKKALIIVGCSLIGVSANAQDAFSNWALISGEGNTEGVADVDASAFGSGSASGASNTAAIIANNTPPPSPKDSIEAPVSKTLFGGKSSSKSSRPSWEGRTRSRTVPTQSAKGGLVGDTSEVEYYDDGAATGLRITASLGYSSRYFYHGLDQIDSAAFLNTDDVGIFFAGVDLSYEGFFLSYKHIYSDGKVIPRFGPSIVPDTYSEDVFEIGYALGILAGGWLDLTTSYQYQVFGDENSYANGEQGRLMIKAGVNRFQWFRPSVAYYEFEGFSPSPFVGPNSVLDGSQLVFQVEGGGQISQAGPVSFGFSYTALLGTDDGYNGGDGLGDMNYYQAGVAFPITYRDLVISPSVTWARTGLQDGTFARDDAWWGISAAYTF